MGMNTAKAANKGFNEANLKNFRYERKFVLENTALEDVITKIVLTNSYGFAEIFERRTVNNIYFDDRNSSFYRENVSGDGIRKKYRIRWYGDYFKNVKNATLEIKKKFGEVGDKISYKLKDFEIDDLQRFDIDQIQNQVCNYFHASNQKLLYTFQYLMPKLYNSYERRYFLSSCGKFRITLDYNMKYYNPNYKYFYNENLVNIDEVILELKYGTIDDFEGRKLSQEMTPRLSKNSKYVRGFDLIYNQ